jgi:hypothetical protein
MMEEQVEKEMFKCYICNESEFDSKQKLSVHQTHCKLKHPDRIERTKRIPFGVPTQRFSPPPEDGFQYRVINDRWKKEPGRVQRALSAGWELVEHERSGENVGTNEDGSEVKGVLMRIPQELYDEDQAVKNKALDEVDEQIYRGEYKKSGNDLRYLPGSGITTNVKLTG